MNSYTHANCSTLARLPEEYLKDLQKSQVVS